MVYLTWLGKLNKNLNYLVAVSGGPDSMFLLDNLVKNNFDIVVCHVNYHKRWSSNVDQKIIEDYCKEHNIRLEIKNVKASEYTKGNFQDQARVIRYDFFNEIAQKYQIYNLVVAHHVYDLLETYLIQKQRKAIVSYYGLKFKSTYKSLSIYRPMLELKKEDIIDYLTLYRVKYGFDETNELEIYERNKIRQQTINKLTDLDINLMLSEIKELNSEQELLKDQLEVIYNSVIVADDTLSVNEFHKYNDNFRLQQMIVYEFLFNYSEDLVLRLKKAKIKEIVRVLTKSKRPNISISLTHNISLIKEYNYVYINEKTSVKDYQYTIKKIADYDFNEIKIFKNVPTSGKFQALHVNKEEFPLTIKNNSGKEQIIVSFGTKKINRLFIDNKIPYRQRQTWPVIVNAQNQIISVPGLAISKDHLDSEPNIFIIK
ncbi:tRNA lysidine(34) synthetase TilS [Spiroplasma attinicola]|uniref:tRNA lysidine(34) synthetase TilS n=1 Tax=Spiroplasma attinicola TaxID=2904537 RepID=UPI002022A62A|nr:MULTISPECIES: tRNA lysidine(34) synthetase TilS [unclassified Spiroplasma]MCL8210169.1 tRNA(Ile)-lysidine synthase [Spiroplasma sp. JKS002670]MCL8210676.1 tRNA(Ile)-lysidine synthase [Spiroplasma sp. JKS002671]